MEGAPASAALLNEHRGASPWIDAPEARDSAVAWSRHGIVAQGAFNEHGAHVALFGETGAGIHATPLVRLWPPPRTPAADGEFPTQLCAPTLVRYSPCGYTLLAYFPATTVAPPASGESGAAVYIPPPTFTTMTPTPTATPALAPGAALDHLSPAPTLPSAGASPALTPVPGTPHALEAVSTLPLPLTNTLVQGDQGVVCLWTRAPHAPVDRWTLHQSVPVSYDASDAACLYGAVLDVLWLGAPRLWTLEDTNLVREPACGPSTFLPRASLPLDEAQGEQACVVVTRAGQVAFLHRLELTVPTLQAFRLYSGWLARASVMPPPPTLDAEPAPERSTLARCCAVRQARLVDVPNESVVLIAYESEGTPAALSCTELQIQLDGEMSFCVVHPLPSLPLDTPTTSDAPHRPWFEWVRTASALALWVGAVEWTATQSVRTCLTEWEAQRADAVPTHDERSAPWGAPTGEAHDLMAHRWTMRCVRRTDVPHHLTAMVPPQHSLPYRHTIWATAWDAGAEAEVWGRLDVRAGQWTPFGEPLPSAWRTRTSWSISPNGVFASTRVYPSGHLACLPLPVSLDTPEDTGRLFALALLRHTMPTDVAHAARAAGPGTYAHLVATIQATARALRWGSEDGRHGPTLPQTVRLLPVVLALVSGATDSAQQRLYDRMVLLAEWAALHRVLCAARTDTTHRRFAWLATESQPSVSFAPAEAWTLAHALRRIVGWLEQSASVSVQCLVPGARAVDVPSDSLLELLAHIGACHLVHEVLAGLVVHAQWLAHVEPAAWAALALRDVRAPTPAQHAAAVRQHALVRDETAAVLSSARVDVTRVMEALAVAPYEDDALRCWDTLLGAREAHLSEAAFYLARSLLGHDALRDRSALCMQYLRVAPAA
ncbi:hypothetical protein MNAN1_001843 [Malassezia nana]|uniref:Uncharacterized protein n=1 Tax=Malassezia nana TaxID=180528 RepID=A0AAF0EJI2_9BASI|nr:hypothetical protein MNAN1_001843 [Malassezia nana]